MFLKHILKYKKYVKNILGFKINFYLKKNILGFKINFYFTKY